MVGEDKVYKDQLNGFLSEYYRKNWNEVESDFLFNLENYNLDQESKETFRESLAAHRYGLYRVAPRLLFPELERVGADEFHDGRHVIEVEKGRKVGIASLSDIRESFDTMPLGEILKFEQSWALLGKLQDHLYKKAEGSEAISHLEADPVPNRHASVHGIISYRTQQTSLNAIIMTDFIFHLMDRLKFYVEAHDDGRDA